MLFSKEYYAQYDLDFRSVESAEGVEAKVSGKLPDWLRG